MAEPNSSAVAGVAIATGAITLSGSVLGLQADALLFGLFGGLLWLMHESKPMSKARMAGTLAAAALVAGMGAPIAIAWLLDSFPWVATVPREALRDACAAGVGFAAQWLLPFLMGKLQSKAGGAA